METTIKNQTSIDVGYEEQDLLNQASKLINQAMALEDSASVRKYEYLLKDLDTIKMLQILQAAGNTMYLSTWDNLLIESHKSVWKMKYQFTYPKK